MTVRYAVVASHPAIRPHEGFEIHSFGLSLTEAFVRVISGAVESFEFKREGGVMRLAVKTGEPRGPLPCDYRDAEAKGDPFSSTNPDDDAARAEIMRRVGEMDWWGLTLVAYKEPLTANQLLANVIASVKRAAA